VVFHSRPPRGSLTLAARLEGVRCLMHAGPLFLLCRIAQQKKAPLTRRSVLSERLNQVPVLEAAWLLLLTIAQHFGNAA
jgi:hypothetical protein